MLDQKAVATINEILKRGNDVEIKTNKGGIQVKEVKKTTKYST